MQQVLYLITRCVNKFDHHCTWINNCIGGKNYRWFAGMITATAVNLSVSCLLYGLCCAILGGLLALDSITVAIIIAVPLFLAVWLITLRYLLRGAAAVNRGERYDVPSWICAPIVT